MNVVLSSDSAAGASSAPKAPWIARAATSSPKFCANPPHDAQVTNLPSSGWRPEFQDGYQEGTGWQYTWSIPQDIGDTLRDGVMDHVPGVRHFM